MYEDTVRNNTDGIKSQPGAEGEREHQKKGKQQNDRNRHRPFLFQPTLVPSVLAFKQ